MVKGLDKIIDKEILNEYKKSLLSLLAGRFSDNITTSYGIAKKLAYEMNPVISKVINKYGVNILYPLAIIETIGTVAVLYPIDYVIKNKLGKKLNIGKYLMYGFSISSFAAAINNLYAMHGFSWNLPYSKLAILFNLPVIGSGIYTLYRNMREVKRYYSNIDH